MEEQAEFHPLNRLLLSHPLTAAPLEPRERRQLRATYYGAQREVDDQLGHLFDYLAVSGLSGGTLVVLTSDHGEMGGDHWLVEKCGYWDESFHVPLIVRDPTPAAAGTRGAVVDEPTESVDVAATILDWLAVEVPRQFDGWPLTPFLRTGRAPQRWRQTVHYEWDFRHVQQRWAERQLGIPSDHCSLAVARSATTKYVQFAAGPEVLRPLLFDLARPEGHTRDLLADGGTGALEQGFEMAQEMLRWRSRNLERSLADCYLAPGTGPVWGRSLWR